MDRPASSATATATAACVAPGVSDWDYQVRLVGVLRGLMEAAEGGDMEAAQFLKMFRPFADKQLGWQAGKLAT